MTKINEQVVHDGAFARFACEHEAGSYSVTVEQMLHYISKLKILYTKFFNDANLLASCGHKKAFPTHIH